MTSDGVNDGLVEQRTVSRKTPGDGKLEVTKVAATRIESLGPRFPVVVDDRQADARIGSMPCICRGDETPHVHFFVESELLRSLSAGSTVNLVLDSAGGRLVVQRV
jgi:hypothetical protein